MKTAILVGNGCSISYSHRLKVDELTTSLLERFSQHGGSLGALAAEAQTSSHDGFENLLGAFDAVSAMIQSLPGLAAGVGAVPEFQALYQALGASRDIHRQGMAIALKLISECSHVHGEHAAVDTFCHAIADLGEPCELTVATLNYDGLLTSGLLQEGVDFSGPVPTLRISDMGDGRTRSQSTQDFSDSTIESLALRHTPDFMPGRARLLHMHGSLGWLRHVDNPSGARKFQINDLRQAGFWDRLLQGSTSWEPVVVLTSRKTELSQEWPFALCRAEFLEALSSSTRWLIAGYGTGDDDVNFIFAEGVRRHVASETQPSVLVVDVGDEAELRIRASESLGIPESWITADGTGLPDACSGDLWGEWASAE